MAQRNLDSGERPAADFEAHKRSHLHTHDLCTAQGIRFVPLVAESGWGPAALEAWQALAHATAACWGEPIAGEANRLYI